MGERIELAGFRPQDIVTVTTGHWENAQGHVRAIYDDGDEDGPIEVIFPRSFHWLHGYVPEGETVYCRFQPEELRRDERWKTEVLADELFPDHYHSILEPKTPFKSGETRCSVTDCEEVALVQGLINMMGSVYLVALCPGHWHLHGLCGEAWPELAWQPRQNVA